MLLGFVVAQAGGLRIALADDGFTVRLFGKLAWTGTGDPSRTYGGCLVGFMLAGAVVGAVVCIVLIGFFGRDGDKP